MLLDLPPELIQLILQSASTPTYIQTAFACRTLYKIASSCRQVALHHLDQTPGLILDVQQLETKRLFHLLARRAFRQLYGAEFRASCRAFGFHPHMLNAQASSLEPSGNASLALVLKGQSDVLFFRVGNGGQPLLKARLGLPSEQPGFMEVLKTVCLGDHDVFVLYRLTPTIDEDDPDAEHPFVKHALKSSPDGIVYLAHFELQSPHGRVRICAFPDHANYEALAIAVANQDTFAISWQHDSEDNDNEVLVYYISGESLSETSNIIGSSLSPAAFPFLVMLIVFRA